MNKSSVVCDKREFCRDHCFTFLYSSLLQKDLFLKRKVKFSGKKYQIIILGLQTQGFLSSFFAFLLQYGLRLTADSSPVVSQSITIISTREVRSRGERGTRAIQIQMTEDELRFTAPSPPFP